MFGRCHAHESFLTTVRSGSPKITAIAYQLQKVIYFSLIFTLLTRPIYYIYFLKKLSHYNISPSVILKRNFEAIYSLSWKCKRRNLRKSWFPV